jgi:choline dehydrogenase-like flavoprotein
MEIADFVIVGSSGGGGTISWLLAKAGFKVVVLEQGPDLAKPLAETLANPLDPAKGDIKIDSLKYNPYPHDEYRFRLERPDPKRRLRGEYNTFRSSLAVDAAPFGNAWTASVLGGGSIIWGTWSYRALPIDFRLRTHFQATGQLDKLEKEWGYSIPDWSVSYADLEPFYNVAETLLAVSGDRDAVNAAIKRSAWYKEFSGLDHFVRAGNWQPKFPFPCPPYPITPVGDFFWQGAEAAGAHPVPLPSGMVSPGTVGYKTRAKIQEALKYGKPGSAFWKQSANELWSDRVRSACNMCGYCGEYLCWGREGPKSGSRFSTLKELSDLTNAEIRTNAKAYEVIYDAQTRRATGVRFLDVSDPDNPRACVQRGRYVIVSCGAVQSARLLLMSGPPAGLGNSRDQVGRYALFHLFGLGITATLPQKFQGILHGEFGHTGNTTSFETYFMKDDVTNNPETAGKWWKAGTMTSTAKKNPLENADGKLRGKSLIQRPLLAAMEAYNRTLEVRMTADDLPRAENRVDLDPTYVDEYGFPVARVTRSFGMNEQLMFQLAEPRLRGLCDLYVKKGILRQKEDVQFSNAIIDLIGDHQMGTCRMGDDPSTSVVDRNCRLHDVPNVFVVDTSFFPTGFGLNPMVTVVANALRVGTWIVEQSKRGNELD